MLTQIHCIQKMTCVYQSGHNDNDSVCEMLLSFLLEKKCCVLPGSACVKSCCDLTKRPLQKTVATTTKVCTHDRPQMDWSLHYLSKYFHQIMTLINNKQLAFLSSYSSSVSPWIHNTLVATASMLATKLEGCVKRESLPAQVVRITVQALISCRLVSLSLFKCPCRVWQRIDSKSRCSVGCLLRKMALKRTKQWNRCARPSVDSPH